MDDFGTGYASLATLQAFPFDKMKIDRSFVAQLGVDPQAAVIVRAVLSLGRSLRMGVVAEGVETSAQRRFLADEACGRCRATCSASRARSATMPRCCVAPTNPEERLHGARARA